jgi:hypothetical protein
VGISQLRKCPREECKGFAIVVGQFAMLGGCATKARYRAALFWAQREYIIYILINNLILKILKKNKIIIIYLYLNT